MQVELTYKEGRVELPPGIEFNRKQFTIFVDISDNYIKRQLSEIVDNQPKPDCKDSIMQQRFNKSLGDLAKVRPATSIADDHKTLMEAYRERFENY